VISETTTRVSEHTDEAINAAIQRRIEESVSYHASVGRQAIEQRLAELDQEWDIERGLEANAAGFSLLAVTLGITVDRKWLWVPGVIVAFLFQHALQGWCPPVPVLRRLGFRTEAKISRERYALKALRGDFREVEPATNEHAQEKALAELRAVER
jgi:hypothetical protein